MRITFIVWNAAKGMARGSRTNSGCVLTPRLPGGLAAMLLGKGHVLIPRPAARRSDAERRVRELSDGEDCERFEHLGLLSSRKLPWKEKAAEEGLARFPSRGWLRAGSACVYSAPPATRCGSAALSCKASLGLEH